MAQRMLDLKKLKKSKTIATQTSEDDQEFCIYLTQNKVIRIYKSKTYKQYVVSFNFGNCKKYLITRDMWIIFKQYFSKIDNILKNE